MKLESTPLVSIIVITYNSAQYVLQTLESAKNQSYPHIELIISDDCSTDNTITICENWLESNRNFFVETCLIQSPKNTGIPSNANRGVKIAKGKWIKLIAGDDMLLSDGIKEYVHFVSRKKSNIVFALPSIISENKELGHNEKWEKKYANNDWFFDLDAKKQFLYLLIRSYPMNPPTLFVRRDVLLRLGYFNEEYLCEDMPLYLKAVFHGYKMDLLKSKTVVYRMHSNSSSLKLTNWNVHIGKIIRGYLSWTLFKSHPFFFWEAYNQNLYYQMKLFSFNNLMMEKLLIIFRLLSPVYILRKINWIK